MNPRQRLLNGIDRVLVLVPALIVIGTTLSFGGAVWWARPALAVLAVVFVAASLARVILEGHARVLKSPLRLIGLLALGLAVVQLAPLPGFTARLLSPRAHELYAQGFPVRQALADDPELVLPAPALVRSPATLDRSATLRWLAGASVCLLLFCGVAQITDRLGRLYLVWGSIVAAFFLNTVFAVVQLAGGGGGLYGFIEPGRGPSWGPSVNDLLTAPNTAVLRPLATGAADHSLSAALVPDHPFLIGSLMGGPGAYLALGALGLPLALALSLQLLAPRGSRESLVARLRQSETGSVLALLVGLLVISAALVGLMAGPFLSVPFALALLLVGLPSAWPSGLKWTGVGLTMVSVLGLVGGVVLGDVWSRFPGAMPPVRVEGLATAARVWADSWPILRDHPILGTGLGTFPTVYPYYKTLDPTRTTALSSLVQWVVESGLIGLALVTAAATWCLARVPEAVRRVGSADRPLVFGLIGAAVGFTLYATVHWTIELAAVAVAASVLAGTAERWLAGATDLFVDRA